jgi:bifunctional non-homologous end joining protein LigD
MGERESLAAYRAKRDFERTPEPQRAADRGPRTGAGMLSFVIQKHDASHLHYDFRLELDGTLKSWAVPKGPSLDPAIKRMAVEVEDHPLSYAGFEGTIPAGQYGAGSVIVWDRGEWRPEGDARAGLAAGKLKFELRGTKLHGRWTLVRMRGKGEKKAPWLLIKERDGEARDAEAYDVLEALPDSALGAAPTEEAAVGKAAKDAAPKPAGRPRARKASGASKASGDLPETLAPQLATLASGPPEPAGDWQWELKFDGYRILARIEHGHVRCFTRNGHDWTARLPEIARALGDLKLRSGWLDGEIVVMGEEGRPAFQSLQNAFDRRATANIVYWLFDLPFCDGDDLRERPIEERRARLAALLGDEEAPRLRFSETFDAPPRDLLESVGRLGFEGVIGKRRGSAYVSRRSLDWIKLKAGRRQEFVIGGYTEPRGVRKRFGALLLGVHDDRGELRYCGNVGTGFDGDTLDDVKARLDRHAADASPFAAGEVPRAVKAHWVAPVLVAEVAFGEWTRDGRVRHGVFHGLRDDKPARQIVRERAVAPEDGSAADAKADPKADARGKEKAGAPARAANAERGPRITHPERVIDAASGVTKGELAAYYGRVAPLLLPHLEGRPVSLVRAPDGIGGELFFQKHAKGPALAGVTRLDAALDPGHAPLLQIDTARGLAGAAQMNVIELHTWNATSAAIDRPDRMTFDLDPGEGVAWAQVQEAALLVRTLLEEIGLVGFLKTSGGKGLHVVVPVRRHYGWTAVRAFSQALVNHLAKTIPGRFSAKSGPDHRVGKVFVDYLRNGFGATTVSAWSVRARPGLGVSVPVAWDELPSLAGGAHWTLRSIDARLPTGNAPWDDMERSRQGLAAAMKRVGFKPPASAAR